MVKTNFVRISYNYQLELSFLFDVFQTCRASWLNFRILHVVDSLVQVHLRNGRRRWWPGRAALGSSGACGVASVSYSRAGPAESDSKLDNESLAGPESPSGQGLGSDPDQTDDEEDPGECIARKKMISNLLSNVQYYKIMCSTVGSLNEPFCAN